MKRSLLAMLLLSQMGQGAGAETPEWAKDAVDAVQKRGVMQGYPNGSFQGQRPTTRNELAEIMERVDGQMMQEQADFAPKSDLDEIRAMTGGLREEIQSLDARVDNLENNSDTLDQRAEEVR